MMLQKERFDEREVRVGGKGKETFKEYKVFSTESRSNHNGRRGGQAKSTRASDDENRHTEHEGKEPVGHTSTINARE